MPDGTRYAFILNPQAGRGKAQKVEAPLMRLLRSAGISYSFMKTVEPLHATRLAASASSTHDVVVAVGGDGTVHEVASGLMGTSTALGVLPVGSGNDFGRLVGMPRGLEEGLRLILGGVRRAFDAGAMTIHEGKEGKPQELHFINSLGIGLDAVVADQVRRITWLRGLPLYLGAVLNTIRHLESYDVRIEADGWSERKNAFVVCVGNGMCEGGGFKLTPGADPHDEKFQVCIIEEMSAAQALTAVPKLIRGTHGTHPKVSLRDARRIEVSSDRPFLVHADGEIIGEGVTRVKAEIRPGALTVIVQAQPPS